MRPLKGGLRVGCGPNWAGEGTGLCQKDPPRSLASLPACQIPEPELHPDLRLGMGSVYGSRSWGGSDSKSEILRFPMCKVDKMS